MEFSRIFDLTQPQTLQGQKNISATVEECQAIAKRFNIPAVNSVEANFRVVEDDSTASYIIEGTIHGEITQSCVVTLSPVDEVINEPMNIKVRLDKPDDEDEEEEETDVLPGDPEDYEDIEYAEHSKVDVGELVVQYLALAMNPYPKKEGVVALHTDEVTLGKNPFAKLAELKKD